MYRKTCLYVVPMAVAMLLVSGGSAFAGLFGTPVDNASFEDPVTATSDTNVTDWFEEAVNEGTFLGGYVAQENQNGFPITPAGDQWLQLISDTSTPGVVYQQIGTWDPNVTYTVSTLVGNRNLLTDSDYQMELWAGGTVGSAANGTSLAGLGATPVATTGPIAIVGNGLTETRAFDLATGSGHTVGNPLWLRLAQTGALATNSVVLFDDVSVTLNPSPPPPPTLYDDFATDPNIAGDWANTVYNASTGTATWNAGDQDLDLAGGSGGRWSLLRRATALRGATDPVTLDINDLGAAGADWSVVGLTVSQDSAPTLNDGGLRYVFMLLTGDSANWAYTVRASNTTVYTSGTFATPTSPVTLSIERNGDDYDFKVDGSTVYTGSSYSAAQHDSLAYYHIIWGDGTNATMTATVDDFGVEATFTSTATGTWDTGGTWDQGGPIPAAVNPVIVDGETVTVTGTGNAGKLLSITGGEDSNVTVTGSLAISENVAVGG